MNRNRMIVLLVGGMAGAATGMIAALLLAPSAGEDVRRGLREGARNLGSVAQDGFEKSRLRVTDLMSSGTEVARQVRDRAGDVGGTLREQAERAKSLRLPSRSETPIESVGEARNFTADILNQAADALGKVQAALESVRPTAP